MYRIVLAIAILCLAITPAVAQNLVEDFVDGSHGITYTEDNILQLPKDQNRFYVTVFGQGAKYRRVCGWFNTVPALKTIRRQTHFNTVGTQTVMFRERYRTTVPATPCVRVQTADGQTIFQVSGNAVPMSGQALAKAMDVKFTEAWRRCRPKPSPSPVTPPPLLEPDIDLNVDAQPDVVPSNSPNVKWGIVAAAVLVGGAGGLVVQWRRTYQLPN